MHPAIRLATAAVIGVAAWAAATGLPQIPAIVMFVVAAIAAALLPASIAEDKSPPQSEPERAAPASDGPREEGIVKWFNVSKGFGFITKDNGEEIFVHFRSIRGEGRRGLRDGQRVSFVEAHTEKGPQAEEVEPL
jgi:CspA family cold shock protein